jgi:hypothetical protein
MRLGMHPSQISQVWALLQQSPEKASAMFGGAPLDAIENEIGGEKRKLDALTAAQQLDAELQVLTDTSPCCLLPAACCLSSVLCPLSSGLVPPEARIPNPKSYASRTTHVPHPSTHAPVPFGVYV